MGDDKNEDNTDTGIQTMNGAWAAKSTWLFDGINNLHYGVHREDPQAESTDRTWPWGEEYALSIFPLWRYIDEYCVFCFLRPLGETGPPFFRPQQHTTRFEAHSLFWQ